MLKPVAVLFVLVMATGAVVDAFADETLDYLREALLPDQLSSPPSTAIEIEPIETVKINVTIPVGGSRPNSMSVTTLRKGTTYRLQAEGFFNWFKTAPGNFADAECAQWQVHNSAPDPTWQQNRFQAVGAAFAARNAKPVDPTNDPLDLYVNGRPSEWTSTTDTGGGCNTEDHKYFLNYTPTESRRLSLGIYDPVNSNKLACVPTADACPSSSGEFVLKIFRGAEPQARPGDEFVESVIIDPRNTKRPPQVRSARTLEPDERYRFIATGTYTINALPGYHGDAECGITSEVEDTWEAHRFEDPDRFPDLYQGVDRGDVFINSSAVTWLPLLETSKGCNADDHAYKFTFTPRRAGTVVFELNALHDVRNGGLVRIDIYREGGADAIGELASAAGLAEIAPPAAGGPPPLPGCVIGPGGTIAIPCEFAVSSSSSRGVTLPFAAKTPYRVESVGTYSWHPNPGNFADAECSVWQLAISDPAWLSSRFTAAAPAFAKTGWKPKDDPLDLYVDGSAPVWTPRTDNGAGCDTGDHIYTYDFAIPAKKSVNFRISDPFSANALPRGALRVRILDGAEPEAAPNDLLVATLVVNPRYALEATTLVALPKDRLHRIVATGTYEAGGFVLDAECSQLGGTWQPNRFGTSNDVGDLLVNDAQVTWTPLYGDSCAENHAYRLLYRPKTSRPLELRLNATHLPQNQGAIVVKIYAVAAGVSL